jgi:predicted Zn-dependent protease
MGLFSKDHCLASPLAEETARQLAETAFMGVFSGHLTEAEVIFQALRRLYPQGRYVVMGLAIVWISAGKSTEALALLEPIKPRNNEEAVLLQVCRAWAWQGQGHHSVAHKILKAAAALESQAAQALSALPKPSPLL